jgi:SCY1-like protein 2
VKGGFIFILEINADLLPRLLTRSPQNRITLASLTQHPYFSSLAISTLNFLDPSNFASKPREEKATFLKGLLRVLGGFSERLRKRKVLPALLDEVGASVTSGGWQVLNQIPLNTITHSPQMKDPYLIPFILPLVFEISKSLQKEEFGPVLTKMQPLFGMKDPPQIMMS